MIIYSYNAIILHTLSRETKRLIRETSNRVWILYPFSKKSLLLLYQRSQASITTLLMLVSYFLKLKVRQPHCKTYLSLFSLSLLFSSLLFSSPLLSLYIYLYYLLSLVLLSSNSIYPSLFVILVVYSRQLWSIISLRCISGLEISFVRIRMNNFVRPVCNLSIFTFLASSYSLTGFVAHSALSFSSFSFLSPSCVGYILRHTWIYVYIHTYSFPQLSLISSISELLLYSRPSLKSWNAVSWMQITRNVLYVSLWISVVSIS